MFWRGKRKKEISFDEILLDTSNLPSFNQGRLEGRIELPIAQRSIALVGVLFLCVAGFFLYTIFKLQIVEGANYRHISENNTLDETVIIAERGVIYDRNGEMLAWNEADKSDAYDFPMRAYSDRRGLGQITGYVSYPLKDKKGFYYRTEYVGRNGLEGAYNTALQGKNGEQLVERDAHGAIVGEHVVEEAQAGEPLTLSIDAALSEAMYDIIEGAVNKAGFRSGAAAIMDVHTGEILAMTSFPSYDPEVMADGDDVALIEAYNKDERFPFLNKVLGGVYTPGSIVKPFMAYAALAEKVIDPNKVVVSNGYILLPNPYDPENPTKFVDWRVQGAMTMREAIAFSSNVYFYIIGGGFGDQKGLGITKIKEYMTKFGLGQKTGIVLSGEQEGTVPDPAWKQEVFEDDWRLGDTYHTSIGQFGFQTTPLQMLRAYGALANGGTLFVPHVEKGTVGSSTDLGLNPDYLQIVHEGMRKTVNFNGGTARALERKDVAIAAKSGTAELGVDNAHVNSWAAGFFPYEEPDYSFILMMDKAPRSNALGAAKVMGEVVEWMSKNTPAYLGITDSEETAP
jgi:penicillin-binding protein 2